MTDTFTPELKNPQDYPQEETVEDEDFASGNEDPPADNTNGGPGGSTPLPYNLITPEERTAYVTELLSKSTVPPEDLSPIYLKRLADYIILAMNKQEKQEKNIITDNRAITFAKRETSYEGLSEQLENGEDGIYNLSRDNKNILFQPKMTITEADVAAMPELAELREAIAQVEEQAKTARGHRAFLLKKQLIEMHQQQYIIKKSYQQPIYCMNIIKSLPKFDLDENITIDEDGEVFADGVLTLLNPKHVSALLCNYSKIKEDTWANFDSDAKWILFDLEDLIEDVFAEKYPLLYDIIQLRIDGVQNDKISEYLQDKHGSSYSPEYISTIWRNKIPKMIAEAAKKKWVLWHFTEEERAEWKKCNCCGEYLPANNIFFSRNSSSHDGYYSLCKECRNRRAREKKKAAENPPILSSPIVESEKMVKNKKVTKKKNSKKNK